MIRPLIVAFLLILAAPVGAVEKLLPPPGGSAPGNAAGNAPVDVLGWVQPLAGRTASACGTHRASAAQSPALACAADAIRQSKPFWILLEDPGLGHSGWTGVVRNADGEAWSIRFDGGSTMAKLQRPHSVTVLTCGSLAVEGAQVRCGQP